MMDGKRILFATFVVQFILFGHHDAPAQSFIDVSEDAGFFGKISSWGAAWGDYDNDDDLDVMTVGHLQGGTGSNPLTGSISQLWRNNGNETFTDVTEAVGLVHLTGDSHGIGWMDLDNDGDLDLFLSNGTIKINGSNFNFLWINDGNGRFTDIAESAGVVGIGHRGRGVHIADYDNDGFVDIMNPSFNWDLRGGDLGNFLYRNNGNLQFTNVGIEAGIERDLEGNRMASWTDFNNDGLLDLFILYRCGLFVNHGTFPFEEVTGSAGIEASANCQSASWTDYDHDGDVDIYVSKGEGSAGLDNPGDDLRDWFYRNNGDGTFTDVAQAVGIVNDTDNRGVAWGDYDNDGYEDLYVMSFRNVENPNRMYRNNGDGTFTEVTDPVLAAQVNGAGADATFIDYNNDGFVDLFLTNGEGIQTGPYVLLENSGNDNHWLKLTLRGTTSHADAIMSKIVVDRPEGPHYYTYTGATHHMAQNITPLHVGLGQETAVENLQVTWPNGAIQTIENVAADQTVIVEEGQSIVHGVPDIQGIGYYVSQSDGRWRITWLGDSETHEFRARITTDGEFSNLQSFNFEDNDTLTSSSSTAIRFTAFSDRSSSDRIEFETNAGSRITLDLRIDGAAQPQLVRLGQHGVVPGVLPLRLESL